MLKVFNHTSQQWESLSPKLSYGIVRFTPNVEFGYFEKDNNSIFYYFNNESVWVKDYTLCPKLYWNNRHAVYVDTEDLQSFTKVPSKYAWPYPINKAYNLVKTTDNFTIPEAESEACYSNLPFTIGIEFETSTGNIPWLDLKENALVPLYDGSITGHEYVTLPLTMKQVPVIKRYLSLLNNFTTYDHNCSLHIHFGGFPIEFEKIEFLVKQWSNFQNELLQYLPLWSYSVENYKDNHKAYNKKLSIRDLRSFIYRATRNEITSDADLYLPNQYDEDEERKWNVEGRYYNMNIMHLVSGKSHKTVEFRFLRPTYRYDEIKTYILILGGFLKWVMNNTGKCSVEKIIEQFDNDTITMLKHNMSVLKLLSKMQTNYDDYGGLNDDRKDVILKLNPLK